MKRLHLLFAKPITHSLAKWSCKWRKGFNSKGLMSIHRGSCICTRSLFATRMAITFTTSTQGNSGMKIPAGQLHATRMTIVFISQFVVIICPNSSVPLTTRSTTATSASSLRERNQCGPLNNNWLKHSTPPSLLFIEVRVDLGQRAKSALS